MPPLESPYPQVVVHDLGYHLPIEVHKAKDEWRSQLTSGFGQRVVLS
jgi:hypothetical protein